MDFDNLSGQTLGQYVLGELIGQGGMGAVYRTILPSLNQEVAIKILPAALAQQPGYVERFQREARIAAALQHPHIVPTFDYGTQRDIFYVVMRLLTGGDLAKRIYQRLILDWLPPSLGESARMLTQLAEALDYAHGQGIIHRDIKTSNIMFDNSGNAYLVDFGIAKLQGVNQTLTEKGSAVGTGTYMPPEQWRSQPLQPAADQYALAVVMYFLLTGRPPFQAETMEGLMVKHFFDAPIPPHQLRPDLPTAVSEVMAKALAKTPDERFGSVIEFAEAFQQAIVGNEGKRTDFFTFRIAGTPQPSPITPRNTTPRTPTPSDHIPTVVQSTPSPIPPIMPVIPPPDHRRLYWVLGGIIILLLAAVAFLMVNRPSAFEPTPTAETVLADISTPEVAAAASFTVTVTPTSVPSDTLTATVTPTVTPSITASMTPTVTPSITATKTATATRTRTSTATATASATSTRTATALPTATIPASTVNDVVFDVSDALRWEAHSMEPIGRNTWELGSDPYLVYNRSLFVCLADYEHILVQLSVILSQNVSEQRLSVYYALQANQEFSENRVVHAPLKPGTELQTVVIPLKYFVTTSGDHLTKIRLDPVDDAGTAQGTTRILDFRLIRGSNKRSACGSASPTSAPQVGSSTFSYIDGFNSYSPNDLQIPNFATRLTARGETYCGQASVDGSGDTFGSFLQDYTIEVPVYVTNHGEDAWWIELRARSNNDWTAGYSLILSAEGAVVVRSDDPPVILSEHKFTLLEMRWYQLRLTVSGNYVAAYVDDVLVSSIQTDTRYRAGLAAIGGRNVGMCIGQIEQRAADDLDAEVIASTMNLPGQIVFTSLRYTNPEIMLMNPTSPEQLRRLTANPDIDSHPVLSPDGNWIAFNSNRSGVFKIYVMSIGGSNLDIQGNNLGADTNPSWSPDGRRIAYTSSRSGTLQTYITDLNQNNATLVSPNPNFSDFNPAWSPNGQIIAFQTFRFGVRDIYSVGEKGLPLLNLTGGTSTDVDAAWSPDGKQLAFSSNRDGNFEIYVMNSNGSRPRRLTYHDAEDSQPTWSPDGKYIAFVSDRSGNRDIWVMKVSNGNIIANLTENSKVDDYNPDWGNKPTTLTAVVPTSTPVPTRQPTVTPVPTRRPTITPVPTRRPTAVPTNLEVHEIEVSGTTWWLDTNIEIKRGQQVVIRYISGTWGACSKANGCYMDGAGWSTVRETRNGIDAPYGSLIGRITLTGKTFMIGNSVVFVSTTDGELFLSMNDKPGTFNDNYGSITIRIEVSRP